MYENGYYIGNAPYLTRNIKVVKDYRCNFCHHEFDMGDVRIDDNVACPVCECEEVEYL
jgi:predicted Zn-ribbon and HTH transcriptional regulator